MNVTEVAVSDAVTVFIHQPHRPIGGVVPAGHVVTHVAHPLGHQAAAHRLGHPTAPIHTPAVARPFARHVRR
jgi:hypothetical protein